VKTATAIARVRRVEVGFRDRCRGGEREREVLRVRPGERGAEDSCAWRRSAVDGGHPARRLGLDVRPGPLRPLLRRHDEERNPDSDLEPVEARVVVVGVASAADEEHHDGAHGHEAGGPAERERRPGRARPRRPEDDDDGDDRDRTEGDRKCGGEQVADGLVRHGR